MLETERLFFREWQPEDWRTFKTIATDPDVIRYISTGQPWPDDRIQRFVDRQIENLRTKGYCLWQLIHKQDQCFIGFCGLQPLADSPEIEIGWWLAKAYWGQGLATEAATAVRNHAFQSVGLKRLVSVVQAPNRASRRVMEKLGMHLEKEIIHKDIPALLYALDNPAFAGEKPGE